MLKTLYLFICLFSLQVYGQSSKIDSLKEVLMAQKGVPKIRTLDELAWRFRFVKDSTATKYALKCLELSRELRLYEYESSSLNILGKAAKANGEIEDVENYLLEALRVSKENEYLHGIARGYNELGFLYKEQGLTLKAIDAFLYSSRLFRESGNLKASSKAIFNLAGLHADIEAYSESLAYYLNCLELREAIKDSLGIARVYRDLGTLSKNLKNYEDMLSYYLKALALFQKLKRYTDVFEMKVQIATSYDYLNQNEKARKTFLEAKKMIPTYGIKDASNLYHNLAALYKKMNVLDSSLYYYKEAQEIFKSNNDSVRLSKNFNNLGNLYVTLGNNQKALANYRQSLALKHKIKDSSSLEKTYHALADYYKKTNDFKKALAYKDSSENIREQLSKKINASNRFELKYIRDKQQLEKEKSEAKLAVANANIEASNERRNTIIITIVLITMLLLFFVFLRVKKLKQEKKLTELAFEQQKIAAKLEKEQQEKKLEELLKEQERKAITSMISGQEEERERIAKDLHDRLGSMLSVVKIHYKSVEEDLEKIKKETKSQYEKANELLDEACEAVRKIAHNMLSGTLTKFGLIPALRELKQKIEETKMLQIELLAHGLDNRLDNTTEIQLYRIIQELLNNILKHAKATEVTIQLLRRETDLNIMVFDNGIGFDKNINQSEGMGLKSIHARVAEMNGHVLIDSGSGSGTTITIEIPMKK